ncbi:sterile alpha motif/pointed domain-containing protein [Artemisia annua]|uniref:Sterile alpha motif/pointed domain-containing protein n=1 Tax=Artemisia annua TaxID=35608 RepID=A0A2U1LUG3_ARTAN|nr:sterile alpha motif/pointed domain-containing protein [Artemisia annua]
MTEPQPPSDTHHHPNGTTTTTTTTLLTTVPPPQTTTTTNPSDPPPPTKRQRRPSVRLGEIGDQLFETTNTNTKRSINNQKYKNPLSKDSKPTSKSIKSLNLGGSHNNFSDSGWKVKSKNSKRVRSNWGALNDDVVDDLGMDDYDDVDRYSDQSLNVSREGGEFRVSSGPSDNVEMERNGVRVWLNQIGLGRYYSVFEVHEVDDEVLPLLTLEDLKDMGINAVGSRRKMFCSIQKLGKGFS